MTIQERVKAVDVLAISNDPPVIVDQDATVRDTIGRMRQQRSGAALVTHNGKLTGIFTERDVLRHVLGDDPALERTVSAVMTANPESVTEQTPIRDAVARMHAGGFRNVPVVDADGAPVGCIRHKDVIIYLVENFADRTLNLPPDPDQIARRPEGA